MFDLRLSNLRGDNRLEEKEALAARKAARDPWKRAKRFVGGRNVVFGHGACVCAGPPSFYLFAGGFVLLLANPLACSMLSRRAASLSLLAGNLRRPSNGLSSCTCVR